MNSSKTRGAETAALWAYLRSFLLASSAQGISLKMADTDDLTRLGLDPTVPDYGDAEYNRFLVSDDDTNHAIHMAQKFLPALRELCNQRNYFDVTAASANATEEGLGETLAAICDLFESARPPPGPKTDWFSASIALLNMVYVPLIIVLGLVGNSLSFMVYLQTRLKVRSSSQYLAALAATDSMFLVNLMCTWIDDDLMSYTASCRALNYMTHVAAFLSAWYVVAFTVERFIAIQFPFHKKHVCSVKRAQYVVVGLLVFGVVFNLPALTPDVVKGQCVPPDSLASTWKVLSVVDMCVTHAIPTLGLIVMNSLISYELFRFSAKYRHQPPSPTVLITGTNSQVRHSDAVGSEQVIPSSSQQQQHQTTLARRGQLMTGSGGLATAAAGGSAMQGRLALPAASSGIEMRGGDSVSSSATERPGPTNNVSAHASNDRCRSLVSTRSGVNKTKTTTSPAQTAAPILHGNDSDRNILSRGTQRRITKTLLIVSTVTVVLNLPSHVLRLVTAFGDGKEPEPRLANFQQLAMLLYYTNFAINFILYAMCGKNFRKCLVEYLRRLLFQCKPRSRNINDSFEMR